MMLLEISRIADPGDYQKERMVLKATADVDVGGYVIFRSVRTANDLPSTQITDTFWFDDKSVKAGDKVVVYSRHGATSQRLLPSGSTAHFYYWGRPEALWPVGGAHIAVLVLTSDWTTFEPPK